MPKIRSGFTLFELLLVIVIILSVYALVIPSLSRPTVRAFDIKALKEHLIQLHPRETSMLVCVESCEKCYVVSGGKKEETSIIGNALKTYHYMHGRMEEALLKEPQFFDANEKICFKYRVDPIRQIGDELWLEYDEKVFYFSPYFDVPMEFETLEAASDFYTINLQRLKD